MPPRLDDCIDNEGSQYIGDGAQDEQYLNPKLPMAGPSIHIGYGPADPHIIQTTIILTPPQSKL
jgi:hypothetical protein